MSVNDYLENTVVNDLLQMKGLDSQPEIVKALSTEHFHTVLWRMLTRKVSSAPVYNEESGEFTGMVDLLDLLTYALISFEESKYLRQDAVDQSEWTGNALDASKVHCISDLSLRNPFVSVGPEESLKSLLQVFTAHPGLHRIPVVDEAGQLVAIVSQSDVALLAATAWTKFALGGTVGQWAVKEDAALHTVRPEDNVGKAFEKIIDATITALPVVDERGAIRGTLSATDLKGAPAGHIFQYLSLNVAQFKDRARAPNRAQITCNVGDALRDVFLKLVANQVHRLWVLRDGKLCGVVTLTDLIAKFQEAADVNTERL